MNRIIESSESILFTPSFNIAKHNVSLTLEYDINLPAKHVNKNNEVTIENNIGYQIMYYMFEVDRKSRRKIALYRDACCRK